MATRGIVDRYSGKINELVIGGAASEEQLVAHERSSSTSLPHRIHFVSVYPLFTLHGSFQSVSSSYSTSTSSSRSPLPSTIFLLLLFHVSPIFNFVSLSCCSRLCPSLQLHRLVSFHRPVSPPPPSPPSPIYIRRFVGIYLPSMLPRTSTPHGHTARAGRRCTWTIFVSCT